MRIYICTIYFIYELMMLVAFGHNLIVYQCHQCHIAIYHNNEKRLGGNHFTFRGVGPL